MGVERRRSRRNIIDRDHLGAVLIEQGVIDRAVPLAAEITKARLDPKIGEHRIPFGLTRADAQPDRVTQAVVRGTTAPPSS